MTKIRFEDIIAFMSKEKSPKVDFNDFTKGIEPPFFINKATEDAVVEESVKGLAIALKDVPPSQYEETGVLLIRDYGSDWLLSDLPVNIKSVIIRNTERLFEIEKERPGIGKALHLEFGISDFARYPKEILIDQFDRIGKKDDRPVLNVVTAKGDASPYSPGMFYQDTPRLLGDLLKKIRGRGRIRVWDVGNKKDLFRALISCQKKYGAVTKLLANAHGSYYDTVLNYLVGTKFAFTIDDLNFNRENIERVKKTFGKNPLIILNSCETGRLGGLAQKISAVLHAKVIAPSYDIAIERIVPKFLPDGDIDFEVKHETPEATQIYINGQPQSKSASL